MAVDTAGMLQRLKTGQGLSKREQTILIAHGLAYQKAHCGPLHVTPKGAEQASEGTLF